MIQVLSLLNDKKARKLFTPENLALLRDKYDISVHIPTDVTKLLQEPDDCLSFLPERQQVDVILHKLVDFIPKCNSKARERMQAILKRYGHSLIESISNPSEIILMDSLPKIQILNDRTEMCLFIDSFIQEYKSDHSGTTFSIPKYHIINLKTPTSEDILAKECQTVLEGKFPIILKSKDACAFAKSHDMYLIHGHESMLRRLVKLRVKMLKYRIDEQDDKIYAPNDAIPTPPASTGKKWVLPKRSDIKRYNSKFVAQQFIPHYGTLFKVYMVGESVTIVPKNSIEDDTTSEDEHKFNSQSLKRMDRSGDEAHNINFQKASELLQLHRQNIIEICRAIQRELELTLIGVDVIFDETDPSRVHLIDINYFPGFDGVPDLADHLGQAIWSAKKNTKQEEIDNGKLMN